MTDAPCRPTEDEASPQPGEPASTPSGYICPRCGGVLWERHDGGGAAFECRIGHPFEALELWVAHCTARNSALEIAARALAENAALARKLAAWSRDRGDPAAGDRIEAEARLEEHFFAQVQRMLDGLKASTSEPRDPSPSH